MAHVNKKRKIDQARIASEKTYREDTKTIRALLKQADESTIVESLVESLEMASAEEVKILKGLLDGALDNFEPELHCVRCHESFLESENESDSCEITHSDPQGSAQDPYDEYWQGFTCCGEDFDKKSKICVTDWHTVHEEDVVYYGDEGVDNDDEYYGQNENVVRCDEEGCDSD
ncbi:hypothetical protein BDV93DRAFT_526960 [Ceratobasidium sp. AG-I]|nr:hypothetical protein BDV93DRAFT_526960 [Ceratobasidium sp. AG-I]